MPTATVVARITPSKTARRPALPAPGDVIMAPSDRPNDESACPVVTGDLTVGILPIEAPKPVSVAILMIVARALVFVTLLSALATCGVGLTVVAFPVLTGFEPLLVGVCSLY